MQTLYNIMVLVEQMLKFAGNWPLSCSDVAHDLKHICCIACILRMFV